MTFAVFVVLTYGLVAIVVLYCLARGIMDMRTGRPRLGLAGIVIGLAMLAASAAPVRTLMAKLDLPHP